MKKTLNILLFIVSLLVLGLIMHGCKTDEPQFNITGEWEALGWSCGNQEDCGSYDPEAVLYFEIKMDKGILIIFDGKYYIPKCIQDPLCSTSPWIVSKASFSDNELIIEWEHGFKFIGHKDNDGFLGLVIYSYGQDKEFSYLWNNSIEIKRR